MPVAMNGPLTQGTADAKLLSWLPQPEAALAPLLRAGTRSLARALLLLQQLLCAGSH